MTPRQSPRVTAVTTGLLGHRHGILLSGDTWPITFSHVKCKHPHTAVPSMLSLQMNVGSVCRHQWLKGGPKHPDDGWNYGEIWPDSVFSTKSKYDLRKVGLPISGGSPATSHLNWQSVVKTHTTQLVLWIGTLWINDNKVRFVLKENQSSLKYDRTRHTDKSLRDANWKA